MGKRKSISKKTGPQPYLYFFRIINWHVSCHNRHEWKMVKTRDPAPWEPREIRESKVSHSHYISLETELLNPVKKVKYADLEFLSSREVEMKTDTFPKNIRYEERPQDAGGGAMWTRKAEGDGFRTATGVMRMSECSFLALLQLLTSGRTVIVEMNGDEFYRNTAVIRSFGWFTEGHPDSTEEMEDAIRESMAGV